MRTFKLWLEETFNRQHRQQIQALYDQVVKLLLGAAKDQTHLPLNDIEGEAKPGEPPAAGSQAVLKKLMAAQVFEKLKAIGDTKLQQQADDVQNWLQSTAHHNDPKETVGELLNRMFGDRATEIYGRHQWQKTMTPEVDPEPIEKPAQPQTPPAQQPPVPPPMGNDPMMPQSPAGPMPPRPAGGIF